jgi:hypothetical protein
VGQALVEVAIALPFVFVLLAGGTQVGAIGYSMVSADTIAREAGRIGQGTPHTSLDPVLSAGGTYVCTSSDPTVETNPVCVAAYQSAGLLDRSKLTVTIKLRGSSLVSRYAPPGDLVRTGSCNASQATVNGMVSGIPAGQVATVSWTLGGATTVTGSNLYTMCATPGSGSLSANLSYNGCTYSGAITNLTVKKSKSYSGENITLTQACSSSSTSTSSSSSSGTSTSANVSQGTTTFGAATCNQTVSYPYYFSVTASYPVGIFVPFVNRLFADGGTGSVRTVTATVSEEIAPCGVTNGQ